MNILGQLAFYSRIYQMWIEQLSTTHTYFGILISHQIHN
uniref:Bm13501, isoform a n=1 Tax=Brugia malayi TaxID=6279 RepID=A0A1I9G380_BRUMA|nr:Bm13501, isoform a [Brugia malayi]